MMLPPANDLGEGLNCAAPSELTCDGSEQHAVWDGGRPPLRRIPNLGHAMLFVGFAALLLLLFGIGAAILVGSIPVQHGHASQAHPKLGLAVQGLAYLGTLGAAWLYFPLVWRESFLRGLRWRWGAVRAHAVWLTGGGLVLGLAALLLSVFIAPPKQKFGLDQFLTSTSDAWLLTGFGIVVAPVFEEICFRGFLLPAFAIAFDWLKLPRTPEARDRWTQTDALTRGSMLFSAVITSALFAMMHFQQDAHLWAVMLLLFCVSLVLTWVRVETGSVAASAVVHAAYNSFNMIALIVATDGYRHLDKLTR